MPDETTTEAEDAAHIVDSLFPNFQRDFFRNLKSALASGAVPEDTQPYVLYRAVLLITARQYGGQSVDKLLENLNHFV